MLDQQNGAAIFECRQFEIAGVPDPINPLVRPQTIGEYYTMSPHMRGCFEGSDACYTSACRDILVRSLHPQQNRFKRCSEPSGCIFDHSD